MEETEEEDSEEEERKTSIGRRASERARGQEFKVQPIPLTSPTSPIKARL